jgi:SAM-dependent methyltransferase
MTSSAGPREVWAVGAAYESYVGRWSRLVAREFASWLGVPPRARWLDVGCGAGALSEGILADAAPSCVVGIDRSSGFAAHARIRIADARATVLVGDAQALPVADGGFDAVVSGLVLNFVSDPAKMVAEMSRAARAGGAVALYVWDYGARTGFIHRFWDAAQALDPAASRLHEAVRFASCAPAPLEALFVAAGLSAVATRAIDVSTRFRDFDDYWSPFLGGQGPAPAYAMALREDRREALRERIRATLPADLDGAIPLAARAWAVRGTR